MRSFYKNKKKHDRWLWYLLFSIDQKTKTPKYEMNLSFQKIIEPSVVSKPFLSALYKV